MVALDYVVLVGYFLVMVAIGIWSMRRIQAQEDFFMGGRSFGKLLQTFAAFGAGTGSSDPVNTARTTYTSGMSGMWSVMYWLFVTPFYWIAAVWYRRMRHLTLGDWFVERYQSRALGAAYAVFGLLFFMVYGSMLFSAIGKVAAPLIEFDRFAWRGTEYPIEYLLVPLIGLVVLVYGIAGGLRAAYYTDLIQGICVIGLSVMLLPYGLRALVERFGDPATDGLLDGFRLLHRELPEHYFEIVGSDASDFPLHRIAAVVVINLIGIVVQPHFIATGGGSARNETSARVGLVVGNFLKRFCTIGWVLTALIAYALFANHPELIEDPDKTWGVASRELLGPGLTGLMLACLLAALMSSIDAYMIVGSGLVVRNIYAPYVNPRASERQYVRVGRWTGALVVGGAVAISLFMMNVFEQLQLTWVFPVLFAAPFWIGMYWRRATTAAAWTSVAFCAAAFFLIPALAPRLYPALRTHPGLLDTTPLVETTIVRPAAPVDVQRRQLEIEHWAAQARRASSRGAAELGETELGAAPEPLEVGQPFAQTTVSGGAGIFWPRGVVPVDERGRVRGDVRPLPVEPPRQVGPNRSEVRLRYPHGVQLQGQGNLRLDFLPFYWLGIDLSGATQASLGALELVPKIILPFVVMILVSLATRPNDPQALDRYYAKMRTPVDPDPAVDRQRLEQAYAQPHRTIRKKLLPRSNLEFQQPTLTDVVGVAVSLAVCFAIVALAVWVARIGAP